MAITWNCCVFIASCDCNMSWYCLTCTLGECVFVYACVLKWPKQCVDVGKAVGCACCYMCWSFACFSFPNQPNGIPRGWLGPLNLLREGTWRGWFLKWQLPVSHAIHMFCLLFHPTQSLAPRLLIFFCISHNGSFGCAFKRPVCSRFEFLTVMVYC